MSDCALSMMSEWEAQQAKAGGDAEAEVELSSQFEELTASGGSRMPTSGGANQ